MRVFIVLRFLPAAALLCLAGGCAKGEDDGAGRDVFELIDMPGEGDLVPDPQQEGEGPDALPDVWDGMEPLPEVADSTAEDAAETSEPEQDAVEDRMHDVREEESVVDAEDGADIPGEVTDAADVPVDTGPCDPASWRTYSAADTPISIPDNDSAGITSWIDIGDCDFEVWDVRVTVNITHTYIGDLLVKLVSPDGRQVILHNETGGMASDIVTTYPTMTDPYQTLCGVTRQSSMGRWGLFVSDNASLDSGQLNSWSLDITGTAGGCRTDWWYSRDSFPMDIPDNDSTGISSTIEVTGSGAITSIRVGVDIQHSYISDLIVSISSPDGTTRILHNQTGGMTSNIHTFYPTPTTPHEDMGVYLGMERMGTWTLNVSDNAWLDSGELAGWLLEVN